jgi:site-specific recombinase XerD
VFHVAPAQKWLAVNPLATRARIARATLVEGQQNEAARYVFTSLRGGPMTVRTVHYVVAAAGRLAGINFPVHPHMLRHATVSIWLTPATTLARSSSTWDTRIFRTRFVSLS